MTKKTSLYDRHVAAGAKMVDFAGWLMPVQYSGVLAEHEAVRKRAGIFDVSHMGELFIGGPDAAKFTDYLVTNDTSKLASGDIIYTVMCDDEGHVLDDLMVCKMAEQGFLLVVNASNAEKDFNWVKSRVGNHKVVVADRSADFGMLAVQGPKAVEIVRKTVSMDAVPKRFKFCVGGFEKTQVMVSRTGYTGEDGVEILGEPGIMPKLWDAILAAGKAEGIAPAGLAARDLLRIEAGYSLYGHELDETTDPLTAGLSWVVKMEGRDFIGRQALKNLKPARKRISFYLDGKNIPRQGCKIFMGDHEAGAVTSGTFSPVLQKPIGIGYISTEGGGASSLDGLGVEIRGKKIPAKNLKLPVTTIAGG